MDCLGLVPHSLIPALQEGVQKLIRYYNTYRPHQTHNYKTPHQIYKQGLTAA